MRCLHKRLFTDFTSVQWGGGGGGANLKSEHLNKLGRKYEIAMPEDIWEMMRIIN